MSHGSSIIGAIDSSFMLLYRHARSNLRRTARLMVTLVPLLALLVGSCRTSQTLTNSLAESLYNGDAAQFRTILFPDRALHEKGPYRPEAGYVIQARSFVENSPQSLRMLTRTEIGYIFGKPSFRRHDADAEVWQYTAGACVVDFYFYGQKQLSHVDVRMKDRSSTSSHDEARCLRNIDAQDFDEAEI